MVSVKSLDISTVKNVDPSFNVILNNEQVSGRKPSLAFFGRTFAFCANILSQCISHGEREEIQLICKWFFALRVNCPTSSIEVVCARHEASLHEETAPEQWNNDNEALGREGVEENDVVFHVDVF